MNQSILSDAKKKPELFVWEGRIELARLRELLAQQRWRVPDDLVAFWAETGGGEVFETESLLTPYGAPELGDDLISFNKELRAHGMPKHYLVFHRGLGGLSAIRLDDGTYVQLDEDDFHETEEYKSLDDWYSRLLRAEYAKRYGLL